MAIAKASKLSEDDQDALAALLLKEIESEGRWSDLFAQSQDLRAQWRTKRCGSITRAKPNPLIRKHYEQQNDYASMEVITRERYLDGRARGNRQGAGSVGAL
jgi:hypothetical protein